MHAQKESEQTDSLSEAKVSDGTHDTQPAGKQPASEVSERAEAVQVVASFGF